ncbi:hypothetical protein ACFFGV_14050 [Pontibacillus salicampi]|uniref:Uncharacterized protein n=1 Tax=Pontibacillus salicampi TaxID=1449801 RepID=A0ABV6LQK2_9BACI
MINILQKIKPNYTMTYRYQCPITANSFVFTKKNADSVIHITRNEVEIDAIEDNTIKKDEKKFRAVCRGYVKEKIKPEHEQFKIV